MANVLLISHDEVLGKAYRARLAKEGLCLEQRSFAHEGLAKARQWTPDLILLDLMLPGMHGLDVLKALRDVPWLVKVPVVLLIERTAIRETIEECLVWGAGSCLYKDRASLEELVAHLRTVLQPGSSAVALASASVVRSTD